MAAALAALAALAAPALGAALPHDRTAAQPANTSNSSWRYRVAGPGCTLEVLELMGFDDTQPAPKSGLQLLEAHDVFVAHSELNLTEQRLAASSCDVRERVQGRPGRDFLVPEGYIPPEQMFLEFELLAATHPDRAVMIDLTETLGTPRTAEGRHIHVLKISDNPSVDEDEPNFLLVGMHHAREVMGPETVLLAAKKLLEASMAGGSRDPEVVAIKKMVEETQIYLAWDWNPDGWRYVFDVDNSWRKNRLPNPDGSFGVDLNRNYPFGWDFSCGGSSTMTSNTYRGPSAGSEPEMQTMVAWQADRRFNRIVDLHSAGRDVRQNYAECAELPSLVDEMYTEIVIAVAEDMGYIHRRSCCTGGEISYAFSTHGSMSILFEQGRSFQPPYDDTMEELETENWPGILGFWRLPTPAFGHVIDAITGNPIPGAQLRVTSLPWNYGEYVETSVHGLFHLWLPTGQWAVAINATGYAATVVPAMEADRETGVQHTFELTPLAL
eukprot:SAG31_NODE_425_length_15822_cov_10.580758_2_plen_496_part_00